MKIGDLLDRIRNLSWGAADILRAYARGDQPPYGFSKALDVEDGGDGPVSAADLAVNSWLIDGLQNHFPLAGWELLSEETAKDSYKKGMPINKEWLWILDPLDGTKDFLQGTGEYAVHLALLRDNKPIFGIVLIPELEELWIGVVGKGAWCEDRLGTIKKLNFSKRTELSELILVSSRNHRNEKLEKLISSFTFGGTKSVGSVGCKIASILRGEADIYFSLSGKTAPKDWDMAAPDIVIQAAGGDFTHADGRSLEYNNGDLLQNGFLIASHGLCHSSICNITLKKLKEIDPDFVV